MLAVILTSNHYTLKLRHHLAPQFLLEEGIRNINNDWESPARGHHPLGTDKRNRGVETLVTKPLSRVASEPLYTGFRSGEQIMIVVPGSATVLSPFTANIYVSSGVPSQFCQIV